MNRHFPIALLVGGVLLIAAATAVGAPRKSVTLALVGGRTRQATACRQTHRHRYHVYRVKTSLRMQGFVVPAPALPDGGWRVKIKFKQCKRGRFVTVAQVHVQGSRAVVHGVSEGVFRYTRPLGARGDFFARAYYYGYTPSLVSGDAYFRVTR